MADVTSVVAMVGTVQLVAACAATWLSCDYCTQVFWECGGTLAAPAIASGVIHKLMAFVAPKIIGGTRAPTPVGELGFVEMTQAVNLVDTVWKPVGPDLMITGKQSSCRTLKTH